MFQKNSNNFATSIFDDPLLSSYTSYTSKETGEEVYAYGLLSPEQLRAISELEQKKKEAYTYAPPTTTPVPSPACGNTDMTKDGGGGANKVSLNTRKIGD